MIQRRNERWRDWLTHVPALATLVFLVGLLSGCTLADLLPSNGASGGAGDGGDGGSAPTTPADVEIGLLAVDAVEVVIRESFPPQVSAKVHGTLPDGCTEVGGITQRRDGNAIDVTIETRRDPMALCTQALVPIAVGVDLEGDFPSGDYRVTVNGTTETFEV